MPDGPADAAAAPPSVAFVVSKLGFEVGNRLAEGLAPLGLEPRHFGLLRTLATSEGQSQRAIGQALDIHPNRMVALVDDLERLRLVQRRPHPTDRRAYALVLTTKGRRVLQKAFEVAFAIENALCAELEPSERANYSRCWASSAPSIPAVRACTGACLARTQPLTSPAHNWQALDAA